MSRDKAAAFLLYAAACAAAAWYLCRELDPSHLMGVLERLLYFTIASMLLYGGSWFYCREEGAEKKKRTMRVTVRILFAAYLALVAVYTLLDPLAGRMMTVGWAWQGWEAAFRENVNLIPLATLRLYVRGYESGVLSAGDLGMNLAGNLVLMMPMAVFLPLLDRKIQSGWDYFWRVSLIILLLEFLQGILEVGSTDIDDYLLNAAGSMIACRIFRTKKARELLSAGTFRAFD